MARISLFCFVTLLVVINVVSCVAYQHSNVAAAAPPKVINGYQRVVHQPAGTTMRLECPVKAEPVAIVSWFKDDREINIAWDRYRVVIAEGGGEGTGVSTAAQAARRGHQRRGQMSQLRVRNVTMGDSGSYVCKATNGFGTVRVSMDVHVFTKGRVLDDSNYSLLVGQRGVDGGRPSCVGDVAATDFEIRMKGVPSAPVFVDVDQMTDHVTSNVGSSEQLTCAAVGNPPPVIIWFKDGVQLTLRDDENVDEDRSRNRDGQYFAETSRELVFRDLARADSGQYQCTAFNVLGSVNFTYNLHVLGAPSDTPEFVDPLPENVTTLYGGSATFACRVRSYTVPVIKWLKRLDFNTRPTYDTTISSFNFEGGQFVVVAGGEDDDRRADSSTVARKDRTYLNKLTLRRIVESDAGLYVCCSGNSAGYSFRQAYLTVISQRVVGDPPESAERQRHYEDDAFLPTLVAVVVVAGLLSLAVLAFAVHRRRRGVLQPPCSRAQKAEPGVIGGPARHSPSTVAESAGLLPPTKSGGRPPPNVLGTNRMLPPSMASPFDNRRFPPTVRDVRALRPFDPPYPPPTWSLPLPPPPPPPSSAVDDPFSEYASKFAMSQSSENDDVDDDDQQEAGCWAHRTISQSN